MKRLRTSYLAAYASCLEPVRTTEIRKLSCKLIPERVVRGGEGQACDGCTAEKAQSEGHRAPELLAQGAQSNSISLRSCKEILIAAHMSNDSAAANGSAAHLV